MKLSKLKTFIVAVFVFLFVFTMFSEQKNIVAQVDDKDNEIIKAVADYKNWPRINKTSDVMVVDVEATDVLEISDSSIFG